MQVTVSRVSPVEVEVTVVVPKEAVTTALARAYSDLGRAAQIRGFRKGKVPLPILKQYYGSRVSADVFGKLVDESLPKALVEQKLDPIAQPNIVPSALPEEGKDLSYKATIEVRPNLEAVVIDGIELKRNVYAVSDADVDHQLEHMREDNATIEPLDPPREARAGDVVTLGYEVTVDGQRRSDLDVASRTVEVGKGYLLGELEARLPGMKAGESADVSITFGDKHVRDELRNKAALLKVTVSDVREKKIPAADDEFAKDLGFESLEALKTKVRADIEKQGKEASDDGLKDAALKAMVEKNPIDAPPSMVRGMIASLSRMMAQRARLSGESFDAEKVFEAAKSEAEFRVKAGLLLGEFAQLNKIQVGDADVQERLQQMADETKKNIARLTVEYANEKKRDTLVSSIMEDKVMALLLSRVKVVDVPADKPLHDHGHHH